MNYAIKTTRGYISCKQPRHEDPLKLPRYTPERASARWYSTYARAECVFVTAHGSKAARDVPCWETAKATAREHGFRIQYS